MKPITHKPNIGGGIMKIGGACLAAAVLVLTVAMPHAAESVSVLLQKAIYAEETEGNLDAAIKIYESITKESDANRSLVAQAQYRLGVCQLKKGKKEEAAVIFRKLVEQFPNEPDLIIKSRHRLAELGHAHAETTVRRLGPLPGGMTGVSPDGRHLIYISGNGDLGLYEAGTGRSRMIYQVKEDAGAYWGGQVSPDSKKIAYVLMRADGDLELYVTEIDPVQPKLIRQAGKSIWFNLEEWSPDGRTLLVSIGVPERKEWKIGLLSPADGSFKEVVTIKGHESQPLRFSPDGRSIAYRLEATDQAAGICLVDVETGKETRLVDHPSDGKPIAWVPNKNTLLFFSDRNGATAIWAADVQAGKLANEPRLVKANSEGMNPLGITRSGDFYFEEVIPSLDVYIAKVNFQTGAVIESPKRATDHFPGYNTRPALSSDGQKLAFHMERKPVKFSILSMATGEQREIPVDGGLRIFWNIAWSKDDTFLWGRNQDSEGRGGIYRLNIQTGSFNRYISDPSPSDWIGQVQFAADGESFLYLRRKHAKGEGAQILRRVFKTDRDETIYTSPEMLWHFAVSPDGRNLVVVTGEGYGTDGLHRSELRVVTVAGGEPRMLAEAAKFWSVHWTRDGRRVVYIKQPGSNEIWSLPATGGEPVKVKLSMPQIRYLSLHPDGETIAFQSGTYDHQVWVMENLLPRVAAAK